VKIYPSLISGNILNLSSVMKDLDSYCDGYHVDVMDDHFVPNLTWGPQFVSAIKSATRLPIHLHLMVDNPRRWVNRVALSGDDIFIFHHEVFDESLLKANCKKGVAINPETNIEDIFSYVDKLDHVLVMSVRPGFSGQKFIPTVLAKVNKLVALRKENNFTFSIGMDGGIGDSNIASLAREGVEMVGVASAIFGDHNPIEALKRLYKTAEI
jgi:ribulose-phosphate 3-epimerase